MGCGYEGLREDMGGYEVNRRVVWQMGIYGAQESAGDMGQRGPMGHIGVLWDGGPVGYTWGYEAQMT